MLKSKIVAATLAVMLVFTSANVSMAGGMVLLRAAPGSSSAPVGVWLIFGCATGIIFAAAIANARDNRQLTPAEAASCGLLFLLSPPRPR